MNKSLTLIATLSFSIATGCAALAALVSDKPLAALARGCGATPGAKDSACDRPVRTATSEPGKLALDWDGSGAVTVNIPARVLYQPGPTAQASVSGDPELIAHVRMRQGSLDWDTPSWDRTVNCSAKEQLEIRLTGPAVTSWMMHGCGALELTNLQQDSLRIAGSGSSSVTVTGTVQRVSLHAAGSVRADLSRLVAQHADTHIDGSAHVELTPREDADISIAGSGLVQVHGTARIRSHVSGSGQIIQLP